jgi:hypothetical protein
MSMVPLILVDGILFFKDLVIAENAQGLVLCRPDAQLTAAFGAGRNNFPHRDDFHPAGLAGFMF